MELLYTEILTWTHFPSPWQPVFGWRSVSCSSPSPYISPGGGRTWRPPSYADSWDTRTQTASLWGRGQKHPPRAGPQALSCGGKQSSFKRSGVTCFDGVEKKNFNLKKLGNVRESNIGVTLIWCIFCHTNQVTFNSGTFNAILIYHI